METIVEEIDDAIGKSPLRQRKWRRSDYGSVGMLEVRMTAIHLASNKTLTRKILGHNP